MKKKNLTSWIARIAVAIIIGQTLFFKFTDAPETVELFKKLDLGASAYKTIGALELVACLLILIPRTVAWGTILSLGLMSGAILAHITKIGFSGPDGTLAAMAIAAWLLSAFILYCERSKVPFYGRFFSHK